MKAFVRAFKNADHYTMMSLNDVIYHTCLCFEDDGVSFAE